MKAMFLLCGSLRHEVSPPRLRRNARRAFSLVEVTLALGLVTFVLVAVLGTVPVALSSGRQSFDQNRAAAVADSLFASFRSQSFSNVCYLDSQFGEDGATTTPGTGLNLNNMSTAANATAPSNDPTNRTAPQQFYASFLDANATSSGDAFGSQRKLAFVQAGAGAPAGASYLVTLYFNNKPDGMTITATDAGTQGDPAAGSGTPAQANQIEMVISPVGQPANKYHFVSTIANRL